MGRIFAGEIVPGVRLILALDAPGTDVVAIDGAWILGGYRTGGGGRY